MKTPFLWAGSKDRDYKHIKSYIPEFELYHEPFVGGGSVYFRLLAERGMFDAICSDINERLIGTYVTMRDDPEGLIAALPETKDRATFDRLLAAQPASPTEAAAGFLYLNRNRFFGMGGWMNADRFARAAVIARIRFFSPLMQKTVFTANGCWEHTIQDNSFVFCDPPYPDTNNAACYRIKADDIAELNEKYLKNVASANAPFFWVTKHSDEFEAIANNIDGVRVEKREWTFRKPGKAPQTAYELYISR